MKRFMIAPSTALALVATLGLVTLVGTPAAAQDGDTLIIDVGDVSGHAGDLVKIPITMATSIPT